MLTEITTWPTNKFFDMPFNAGEVLRQRYDIPWLRSEKDDLWICVDGAVLKHVRTHLVICQQLLDVEFLKDVFVVTDHLLCTEGPNADYFHYSNFSDNRLSFGNFRHRINPTYKIK